jgi:hypothetical protein
MIPYMHIKSTKVTIYKTGYLQLCPVLWVALIEEVDVDPDRLVGADVERGSLDLGVAEQHLRLDLAPRVVGTKRKKR